MRQSGGAIDRGSCKRYKDRTGEVILTELSYPLVSQWLARRYAKFGAWISMYYEPGSDTVLSHLLYVSVWMCYSVYMALFAILLYVFNASLSRGRS